MISVVLVDYNSIEKTLDYIDHLNEFFMDSNLFNFIIVDNSNNFDNFNLLEKRTEFINIVDDIEQIDIYDCIKNIKVLKYKNKKIIAINSSKNLGYAKGNNLGALASKILLKDEYYLFSNNDLILNSHSNIREVLEIFIHNPNVAIIGPKIIGIDKKEQSPRKELNIYNQVIFYYLNLAFFTRLNKKISNIDYSGKSKYTYWVSGCFMIVDKNKFLKCGMFDENTFLYAEEMILSERLKRIGYSTYFYNNLEIIHNHGSTTKNTFSFIQNNRLSFESNLYYFEKYKVCSFFEKILSKLAFNIFKLVYPIKKQVKIFFKKKE